MSPHTNSSTLATWCKESTHWKRPWCWEDRKQEEKGSTEDEMVGWHHQLDEHESERTPEDGNKQGSLACCSPRGCKESDMTERLNKNNIQVWIWGAGNWSRWFMRSVSVQMMANSTSKVKFHILICHVRKKLFALLIGASRSWKHWADRQSWNTKHFEDTQIRT